MLAGNMNEPHVALVSCQGAKRHPESLCALPASLPTTAPKTVEGGEGRVVLAQTEDGCPQEEHQQGAEPPGCGDASRTASNVARLPRQHPPPRPNDTLPILQRQGRCRGGHVLPVGIILDSQGDWWGQRGWPGQRFRLGASGGRPRRRDPAARPLLPLGPAVMALQRGPLLLLTLSLGLASAQKTLEEVPVQPGFNAHKVMELGRVPGSALGCGGGCPVLGVAASRSRTRERAGEGRSGPRISLCPAQAGTGVFVLLPSPGGREGPSVPPALSDAPARHPSLWGAWLEQPRDSVVVQGVPHPSPDLARPSGTQQGTVFGPDAGGAEGSGEGRGSKNGTGGDRGQPDNEGHLQQGTGHLSPLQDPCRPLTSPGSAQRWPCWGLRAKTGGSRSHTARDPPPLCTLNPAGGRTLADRPAGCQPCPPGLPSRSPEARPPFHLDPGRGHGVRLVLDVSMTSAAPRGVLLLRGPPRDSDQ